MGPETSAKREEGYLTYHPLDDESQWKGKRPAQTLYPQQLVEIYASLPYKAQLENIREALRLDKVEDVLTTADAIPVFRGVQVERRVFNRSGRMILDWTPLNYEENYRQTIYQRSAADQIDDPSLDLVKLDPKFGLVLSEPLVLNPAAEDSFRPVRLKTITDTIAKITESRKIPVTLKAPSRMQGGGDIFSPRTLGNAGNLFQYGNGAGADGPGSTINPYLPGMMRPGPKGEGMTGGSPVVGQPLDLLDYALVRILDNAIRPGDHYQYRLRIRMENPNSGKNELMSRSSDANEKELVGEWLETPVKMLGNNIADLTVPGLVSIPPENFLYATEPVGENGKPAPVLKPNQAMLQVQRWVAQIDVDTSREPVGDWLVANVPVSRGMYVGGKQLVQLPLWSSVNNWFVMREQPIPKGATGKTEPKKGIEINPVRAGTDLLLVDFTGGRATRTSGQRTLTDDAAVEMLLLDGDGNLQVRSSAIDRQDPDRIRREENWYKWIADIKKYSDGRPGTTGTEKPGFE